MKRMVFFICLGISLGAFAQPTPPPTHGNNTTVGHKPKTEGDVPIATSTTLLLGLGVAYFIKKRCNSKGYK
jgi:hypothetical protein